MENDDNRVLLRGMFEVYRHQVLVTKLDTNTRSMYTNAYVYALLHRVCPAYDNQLESLQENAFALLSRFPFEDVYDVKRGPVEEVAEFLDAEWMAKRKVTFYDVEHLYKSSKKWQEKFLRPDLIAICRYLFLHDMFDADFWKSFCSNAPSEAHALTHDWDNREIMDWV